MLKIETSRTVNPVNPNDSAPLQSKDVEWWTPPQYTRLARKVLGDIDLDPASCAGANRNVQARIFCDKAVNGLTKPWFGRVYMNPPYGKKGRGVATASDFVNKLMSEIGTGRVTQAVVLLNSNSIESVWFRPLLNASCVSLINVSNS
jgi:ParB family chromosome partitioning protein